MVRSLALLAFGGALLVLATDWAVRHRHLRPSGWWPRMVERWSRPVRRPLERRLMRAGANPLDASLWLLGAAAVGGLLATGLVRWISGTGIMLHAMRGAGPDAWLLLGINAAISLLMLAILIRVIGSWLGVGRYHKLMRPVYVLTDWLVEPISRRLPAMGRIDVSPLLAYILLLLLRGLIDRAIG